jgi:hypothetical protein
MPSHVITEISTSLNQHLMEHNSISLGMSNHIFVKLYVLCINHVHIILRTLFLFIHFLLYALEYIEKFYRLIAF